MFPSRCAPVSTDPFYSEYCTGGVGHGAGDFEPEHCEATDALQLPIQRVVISERVCVERGQSRGIVPTSLPVSPSCRLRRWHAACLPGTVRQCRANVAGWVGRRVRAEEE